MSEVKNRPGPKTKASRGERRYVKLSITIQPNTYAYFLSQRRNGETISHLVDRLFREHREAIKAYPEIIDWFEEWPA